MKKIKASEMVNGLCYYWIKGNRVHKIIKIQDKREDIFTGVLDVKKDQRHLIASSDYLYLNKLDALYELEDHFLFYLNQTRDKIRKLES